MAGVLVDVLLERLATLALDKIEQEMKLVVGVKKEIKNLTKKLEAIQAVLEDAEQRQVTEASVRRWLSELTEVSFDMDDVLDEWITKVLRHQLEKQEKQSSKALVTNKKKVYFPFPSSCLRFGKVDYQLFLRHEIAAKIKELNESLALIAQNKQDFKFQTTTRAVPELPQRSKTTSLPHIRTFGRENEKNHIISKLLGGSSEENEVPLIIPIVGMGGMGKTTLAQLVYNDEDVKSYFDSRIWVCVSDPFEEIKIAKAIIEGLDRNSTSNELQTLTQCIYKLLEGKRFLLVLDDVWNPTRSQWEELIKPLQKGAMGSRVLVTTRNENVATLMKAKTQMILLKELSEVFCLSLFYNSADMDESSVSKEFKDIGLEIVKRCDGLPLAAKTLGSLMRNKKTIHEWETVLKSEIWALKEMQQDVFRPLLLSYHDLTLATKRCLLYCAIFPKDYVYNKNHLIELWMSQDYLNAKRSEEIRIVGQNCFDDLVLRSFFQDIDVYVDGNVTCKIHDIVHDFLQYLTENEIKRVEFHASERKEVSNDKVHHLTLVHASDSFLDCLLSYKRLRTFTVLRGNAIHSGQLMFELIVELKSLRTLTLGPWGEPIDFIESIPEKIGELIHLRYLDLSGNSKLKELPSVIGSLYNLQTLRLVDCENLEEIDVRRLINLRHLHLRFCVRLRLIKGIEKLRDLQTLDWFRVRDVEGNMLEDLKDLNQLQGSLEIEITGNPKMAENAAILVNKPLLELSLRFCLDPGLGREIMNGLEPHPGLECLTIGNYEGAFSPWLSSLHSLRVLSLESCYCQVLPSLGKLASLESLTIQYLYGVEKVGVEFLGIEQGTTSSSSIFLSFPKLRQLVIWKMESWEEWEGVEEENSEKITIMPCLSELTIYGCKELKALPDFLWKTPLQKLTISESPILKNLYREEIGEQWAKISHIPNTNVGWEWVPY
ncbi:PREDICTED: putative disease resistance protein RGA3-like [Fragaria vesca subsp. vesca]|uniref:putative disease resistance protein RGA3 n=1 Tax=Fragaria vesca subsp. vesca TaxID=101020 RepID=UPI0002C2E11A|nr:PREDICTED: putative disease resistance protein RGA3 [Fragaria vesca subsp. vesca]XP_011469798.1 PREDICTED: putative disease resistance protein RGA3 [Fragaria vesca subsp. vesca]XP_011469799.1 PREDICTED: putative disease resistance protein RGA3 [Fragaria vesca subsp. vesca]XP_011469800.1 PREDICTED: putative disease resistance protein RGA3 [Fragaria vesca subsp. vesca]XP_011469801.1 PREDICTED: putative disease resistance protein RGA3 [Fragaria vesca subsp. vesca]XP_011469802.1 PREDICTED: puta